MQAIDYVIRDGAGRLSRGEMNSTTEQLVLSVEDLSHVSLNLNRDDVHSYRRAGNNLIIELEDGREIVLEGMFVGGEDLGTRLFFSEAGEIHEISFSESWGRTNFAQFNDVDGLGNMVFQDSATTLAEVATATTPEVTMAAPFIIAGGGAGVGAAGVVAGVAGAGVVAAGLGGSGGSDDGGDNAAQSLTDHGGAITSNGTGSDGIANSTEIAAGLTVEGFTYPNTSVTITLGSTTITTLSGADGTYSATFDPNTITTGEYDTTITATVVNPDGDTQSATSDISVDTLNTITMDTSIVEGDGLILASETADGTVITGTSQAGSNVVVTANGQNAASTTNSNGDWSVTFPSGTFAGINDQSIAVTAQSTDLAGNVLSVTQNVQVDTVLNVTIDVNQAGDDIINRGEASSGVTFTGTTDPGAFVSVEFNGITHSATVAANGTWTVDFATAEIPGANTTLAIQAHATDALGNATSTSHTVYVDHEGMVAIDAAPVEIDDIVNLNEQGDGVTITGTSTPGSVVVVHFHTFTGNATVAADGSWTVDVPASNIDLGTYEVNVTATATTVNGNVSQASDTVQVDTLVDQLDHTGLVSGDGFINAQEQSDGVLLSGTVEPGSTVTVELNDTIKTATVDANGNWSVTFTSSDVDEGDYQTTMTATAIDVAGNTQTISQTVQVDTVSNSVTLSAVPIEGDNTVNAIEASDGIELGGQADPGVTITVTLGGVTHTVTADPDGTWTVFFTEAEVTSNDGDTPLIVQTSDAAGNVTTVNSSLTIDTEVSNVVFPAAPIGGDGVVNAAEVTAGVPVEGTGEPGATVVVAVGNQSISTVVAGDGTWSVILDATLLPAGEQTIEVVATLTDSAGNVANITQSIFVDTLVTELSVSSTSMQTEAVINDDGVAVLNSFAAQNGIDLSGTVEIGSTVMVTFEDTTKPATVNADGTWTVTFMGDEVRIGEYETTAIIVATDAAGNTSQTTSDFTMDTSIPEAPSIISISTNVSDDTIRGFTMEQDDNSYDFAMLNADETVTNLSPAITTVPGSGELDYHFNPDLPAGSDVIITLDDGSGNETSTLFVLDDLDTPTINAGNAGLDGFEIEAIDLWEADGATLEITEAQLTELSSLTDSLLVRGSTDDTVVATDAVLTDETRDIDGQTYEVYTMGTDGAILVIDEDINVIT